MTTSFGLQIATLLLVALGAMAMSSEGTARTLNTMLCRPIRRIEFVVAKALSLVFAMAAVILATGLGGFVVGGLVRDQPPPRSPGRSVPLQLGPDSGEAAPRDEGLPLQTPPSQQRRLVPFLSYGDIVDPRYPDTVIVTMEEVLRDILYGFLLFSVPVFAAVSMGFVLGTLIDSAGLAIGLAVGLFMSMEIAKFFPPYQELLGRYTYNYPLNEIFNRMSDAAKGAEPNWAEALAGVQISALYIAVFLAVSFVVERNTPACKTWSPRRQPRADCPCISIRVPDRSSVSRTK